MVACPELGGERGSAEYKLDEERKVDKSVKREKHIRIVNLFVGFEKR